MTREECISVLQALWRYKDCEYSENEIRESLDMAIKSLEQEFFRDVISRQAVLDINESHHGQMPNHINHQIWQEINDLPSVHPKQRWIPVSEMLPENKTYVLTTIYVPGRQRHARSGWYQDGYFHNDNGDVWNATDPEVEAWLPLPEPYN